MLLMKFLYIWIIGSCEEEVYMYFPKKQEAQGALSHSPEKHV